MQITTPAQLYLLFPIPSHIPEPNPSSLQFWEQATMFLFLTTLICLPDSLSCLQGQNWKHTVFWDKMLYKIPFGGGNTFKNNHFATSLFIVSAILALCKAIFQFSCVFQDFPIIFKFFGVSFFLLMKIVFWMKYKIENTFWLFMKFWQTVQPNCFFSFLIFNAINGRPVIYSVRNSLLHLLSSSSCPSSLCLKKAVFSGASGVAKCVKVLQPVRLDYLRSITRTQTVERKNHLFPVVFRFLPHPLHTNESNSI